MNFNTDYEFNYIEIVKINKKIKDNILFDISFSDDQFIKIFQNINNSYPKYFQKHTIKYIHDSLELVIDKNDESSNVHHINMINTEQHDNFLINYYMKKNLPTHMFPSTTNIIDKIDTKRYTFKITNHVFINFETLQYSDDSKYNHIYINYNLNKNNDLNDISNIVNDIILKLQI